MKKKDRSNIELIDEGGCLPVFILLALIVVLAFIYETIKLFI